MAELLNGSAAIANGINWIAHAGDTSRDLPPEFGEWTTGQQWFRRWTSGDCHPLQQDGRAVRGDPLPGAR